WEQKNNAFRVGFGLAWALGNRQILCLGDEGLERIRGTANQIYQVGLLDVGTGQVVRKGKIMAEWIWGQHLPDGSWGLLARRGFLPQPGKYRQVLEEYDLDGKALKQWPDKSRPCDRFREGSDLILDSWGIARLAEVDPKGRVLWEAFHEAPIGGAQRILGLVRLGFSEGRPADLDRSSLSSRIKGLRSPNKLERSWSAWAIGQLGAKAAVAAPALIEGLADPAVDGTAAEILRKMGPSVVPLLLKVLKHKDSRVRKHAADCLNAYKSEHKVIIPALLEAVKDTDPWVRAMTAQTITIVCPDPTKVVPALLPLVEDPSPNVRWRTICSLGRLGPAAKPAVSAIIR